MDRRHQLILTLTACGALGAAMLGGGPALRAQEPPPAPSPTAQTPPPLAPLSSDPSQAIAPSPEPPRRPRPLFDRPLPPPGPRPMDPKADRKLEKQEDRQQFREERRDILDRMKERRDIELNKESRDKGPKPDGPPDKKGPKPDGSLREMLDRLPPGPAREEFQRNMDRWREMPPGERQELRAQAGQRVERMQEEVNTVMRDSGLQLTDDQRQVFRLRYVQERRKLERSLREHMEAERTRRMPELIEALKREFNRPPAPAPHSGPQPPPRPPSGGGPAGSPPPPPPAVPQVPSVAE